MFPFHQLLQRVRKVGLHRELWKPSRFDQSEGCQRPVILFYTNPYWELKSKWSYRAEYIPRRKTNNAEPLCRRSLSGLKLTCSPTISLKNSKVKLGKPTDNAFIESFNGRLREECLNQHWFTSLEDAKQTIEGWRQAYNRRRPHSSLGYLSPAEYLSNWTSTETRTKTFETAHF